VELAAELPHAQVVRTRENRAAETVNDEARKEFNIPPCIPSEHPGHLLIQVKLG
jgi:hypothetical protein